MSANENLRTPVEIDTAIAQASIRLESIVRRVAQLTYLKERRSLTYNAAAHHDLLEQRDQLEAELRGLNAQYTGWPRYWHVTNANGHIHTSMSCPSCFPDTEFAWRTDLSGASVEEVVDREAYNACTVCMPIAPAEQKAARERDNAERRAARKAEKQAKADEKLRKAAERAQKLLAKVEVAVESLGGWETIDALPQRGTGSLYEAIYGYGAFEDRKALQATVGDELSDQARERQGEQRPSYHPNPRKVIAEAREKGLI